MPSLQLSPRLADHGREFDTILDSIGRLRDHMRAMGLAPDHPHLLEIEDIWWRTKRFIERIDSDPDTERDSAPDTVELLRLFDR